jgi:hypothetical protein
MLSNRDSIKFDEKHLKMIVLTLLYSQNVYFVQSEEENEKKYSDILLRLINQNDFGKYYQYLFELKYIQLSNFTKKEREEKNYFPKSKIFQEKLEQAKKQIEKYEKTEEISNMKMLEKYVIISN